MSNNTNWLRKTAFVGLGSALALGTAVTFAGSASAEINDDSFDVVSVAAAPDTDDVTLGLFTITEEDEDDFLRPGAPTTFTLTLDNGATFDTSARNAEVNVAAPAAAVENAAGDDVTVAGNQVTFTVNPTPADRLDTITISGLVANVPANVTGDVEVDLTATPAPGEDGETVDPDDLNEVAITLGTPDGLDMVTRISGQDRYDTAAQSFRAVGAGTAGSVVLAGGGDFPDALSANGLAGRLGSGVLLTRAASLPDVTRQAILDSGVSRVYLVGGTTAVSRAVEAGIQQLRVGNGGDDAQRVSVIRISGANRYSTNQAVNLYTDAVLDDVRPVSTDVLVASGEGFADAVAMGPVTYASGRPLILTQSASLTANAEQQIETFNPTEIDIAGGTASVSAATVSAIDTAAVSASARNIDRHAGAERTATATQIATWVTSDGDADFAAFTPASINTPAIANGAFYADALSAGSYAGAGVGIEGGARPILLTQNTTTVGAGLTSYLGGIDSDDVELTVFGGSAVMPRATINKIAAALGD